MYSTSCSCKVLQYDNSLEWTSKGCAEWGVLRARGVCKGVVLAVGVARSILLDPAWSVCLPVRLPRLASLAFLDLLALGACSPHSQPYMLFGHEA
jgi:hypothetical protein